MEEVIVGVTGPATVTTFDNVLALPAPCRPLLLEDCPELRVQSSSPREQK